MGCQLEMMIEKSTARDRGIYTSAASWLVIRMCAPYLLKEHDCEADDSYVTHIHESRIKAADRDLPIGIQELRKLFPDAGFDDLMTARRFIADANAAQAWIAVSY